MSGGILAWQDPPEPKRPRSELVMDELRAKPGEWALIAQGDVPRFGPVPWWTTLMQTDEFETRIVHTGGHLFGTRDVYARKVDDWTPL